MGSMPKKFMDLIEPITETLRKVPPGNGLKIHNEYIDQMIDAYLDGQVENDRVGLRIHLLDKLAKLLNCRWRAADDKVGVLIYRPAPPKKLVFGVNGHAG